MFEFAESAWNRLTKLDPFPQPPLLRVRYPIVLMHGFGFFASMRRGGHLHHEALNLRSHGVTAYAPNVSAYETVRVRSEVWKKRLEFILKETGAERVNVIAHSMGGLDARYLISVLGMHDVIASLVTVSTPHAGSGVAEMVLERPQRVRQWTADVLNWMGTSALPDATADFQTSVSELTPEFVCKEFNPDVQNHPDVRYYSYAGRAGKGTEIPINPILQIQNRILYAREGVNDGFVSIRSAEWGEFLGTIDADHAQQVGITFATGSDFNSNEFYCQVVERLAADEL